MYQVYKFYEIQIKTGLPGLLKSFARGIEMSRHRFPVILLPSVFQFCEFMLRHTALGELYPRTVPARFKFKCANREMVIRPSVFLEMPCLFYDPSFFKLNI